MNISSAYPLDLADVTPSVELLQDLQPLVTGVETIRNLSEAKRQQLQMMYAGTVWEEYLEGRIQTISSMIFPFVYMAEAKTAIDFRAALDQSVDPESFEVLFGRNYEEYFGHTREITTPEELVYEKKLLERTAWEQIFKQLNGLEDELLSKELQLVPHQVQEALAGRES